jgi:hypothetical protein
MIHRPHPNGTLLIGQPAHAWMSGRMARAWKWPFQPWEDVCLAAEQHDIGMAAWERHPTFNAETGLPRSLMELTLDEHLGMWSSAAGLVLPQSRYAALLVSMHGSRLYKDLDRSAFEREIRATLDVSDEEIERNSRLIATWDGMSLALLLGWRPWADAGIQMHADGRVEPWPFTADSLTVRTEGRLLRGPNARIEDAPWVGLSYELRQ